MKKIFFIIIIILSSSCSSLRKSIVYGGLSGAAIGGFAGSSLSPDTYSRTPNAFIWGGLGLMAGAALGYFFFNDDPENRELPQMILKKERKIKTLEDISAPIVIPTSARKYKVQDVGLPASLKSKVPIPSIIEMTIPERIQKLENGRTIVIEEHKATEVVYE
jgi:hypothetical protein